MIKSVCSAICLILLFATFVEARPLKLLFYWDEIDSVYLKDIESDIESFKKMVVHKIGIDLNIMLARLPFDPKTQKNKQNVLYTDSAALFEEFKKHRNKYLGNADFVFIILKSTALINKRKHIVGEAEAINGRVALISYQNWKYPAINREMEKYYLTAITTHEWGHLFGLEHPFLSCVFGYFFSPSIDVMCPASQHYKFSISESFKKLAKDRAKS